jgi:hypothetical protein
LILLGFFVRASDFSFFAEMSLSHSTNLEN